jgi:hypothetical protein
MANQAIALQARAPQTDFMGRAIQQNAQMMNMMSQRRAAERQNAIAQQQMEIARAGEARAAAKEGRDIGEFKLKQIKDVAEYFRDGLASWVRPGDVVSTQALRDEVVAMIPAWDKFIPPAEALANDPKVRQLAEMRAQEIVDYKYTKPVASVQIGKNAAGEDVLLDTRVGGTEAPAALEIPQYGMQAPGGAAPTAFENAFPTTATPATDAQIEEAAQKIIRGAGVGELGIGAEDFDRASARANQLSAGGGARMQPISMTAGPQTSGQPDLAAVVQDMMQTKQVTESNRRMMLDVLPPESAAQFDQILKAQNIRTVPDAQPQMRSAVFRPGEDAMPQMQQVQAIPPGYQPTGRAAGAVARPAPLPGSAQVPIPRVRAEAEAKRETPQEAAAKATAVARANADVAAAAKRAEKLPGRKNVSTIVGKMRAAYEKLDELEAITSEKRGGLANFFDYLGSTTGGREIQKMYGSEASKYFTQIATLRKQLATAIKNATGMSAQEMNSNVELQLTLDSLSDPTQGIEAALQTIADIEELYGVPKPVAGQRRTPTGGGVDKNNPLLKGM